MTSTDLNAATEQRVFFEQLRMPLRAMLWPVYPGLLLMVALWGILDYGNLCGGDERPFEIWCAVASAFWIGSAIHSRRNYNATLDAESAARLYGVLKIIYGVEGAIWGALPFVTADNCGIVGMTVVLVVNAGVAAARMMALSSLPLLFFIYLSVGGVIWIGGTWNFTAIPFHGLTLLATAYVLTLMFLTRTQAGTLVRAIRLGFENKELLEKLHAQMAIAESARQRAEEANQAKSKFLAAASHDLRQPAQAQAIFLEVLSHTELDAKQRTLVDNIVATSRASAEMLGTLLDFSRIEAGVLAARRRDFRLQALINTVESEFGPQADIRNLVYRSRETSLVAHSDPDKVIQILRNLVSNAIRYTEKGGVLVGCRRRGDEILLEVWDTGLGIAPEHQAEIFQEFLQLNNPERDRQKGLGLGLAIVDGLSRHLGHELTLSSRPGRGSVFRLRLPRGSEATVPAEAPAAPVFRPQGAKILVIDDDASVRAAMLQLLPSWGYHCDVVESGDEALALARVDAPDLIISDYRLRDQRTGAEAIFSLRALLGDVPALLITGDTDPARLAETHASRIPLLHKPISPDELQRQLAKLLHGV